MGGVTHGAVEFGMATLHSFESGAYYYGSAEMDLGFDQIMRTYSSIEHAQANRMDAIGNSMMRFHGVTEDDLPYHFARSGTKIGLEVASAVSLGYGVVRGGLNLYRFVRASKDLPEFTHNVTKTSKTVFKFNREILSETSNLAWPSASKGRIKINGIVYTVHALERMSPRGLIQSGTEIISRGVPPSVVENAIKFGIKKMGKTPNEIVHVFENVRVVTNFDASLVITVIKVGE
jgi:hypothetical protein